MHTLIEHLVKVHNCRRIAYTGNISGGTTATERYQGYIAALEKYGIAFDKNLVMPHDRKLGRLEILLDQRKLRPGIDFEAIITHNDGEAAAIIQQLQSRGVKVPDDVAVLGVDNNVEFRTTMPPLTTAALPTVEMGQRAVEMLAAQLRGEQVPQHELVPPRLVVRRSCGCFESDVMQIGNTAFVSEKITSIETLPPEQRQNLLTNMEDAMHKAGWNVVPDWATLLLDAFITTLTAAPDDNAAQDFLATLSDILYRVGQMGGDVGAGHIMLSTLRGYFSPAIQAMPTQSQRINDLREQGRVLVNKIDRWAIRYQQEQIAKQTDVLNQIGPRLTSTFDLAGLINVLTEDLPQLNITRCFLYLYDDPTNPTSFCRLVFAYTAQGPADLPVDNKLIPSQEFLQEILHAQEQYATLIVQPLFFNQEHIGLLLLDGQHQDYKIYEILRAQISSALKSVLVQQERETAKAALEQQALELQKAKESAERAQREAEAANITLQERAVELVTAREEADQARRAAEAEQAKAKQANTALQSQIWQTTGQAELSAQMRGEQKVHALANNIIQHICEYIGADSGVLYIREDMTLKLVGSYAPPEDVMVEFQVGRGLLGQVAQSGKPITRTGVTSNQRLIASGLLAAPLYTVVILPLLYEQDVVGVMEIGSFAEFSEIQTMFLESALENIAIAFNTAQARAQINELYAQTQQQAMELQTQSEELRAANEELEAQTQSLRVSEARLREQQEELEATNTELEEKAQVLQQQQSLLDRQNQNLRTAQTELEHQATELARASQYKSEFLANMSHELRTPLNSLLILARMLANNEEGNLLEEQVESASIIYNSGSDLLHLINEILDLSKVEAGKMDFNIAPMPLADVQITMHTLFDHVVEERHLEFITTCDPETPTHIETDAQRVAQIIKNLLSNAFKFTESGSVNFNIAPITYKGSPMVAFSVTDTGIGMTEEQQHIVFEAFQQADGSTSRKYGGTGLGLTISRELAHRLGGELTLKSAYGEGSTFTLYLPRQGQEAGSKMQDAGDKKQETRNKKRESSISESASQQPASSIQHPASSIQLPAPSVPDDRETLCPGEQVLLIIEDDANFAKIVQDYAHKKGFKSLIAEDGRSGLLLAEQHRPNAIILDLNLPVMDGWEVLDALKDNSATRHIPVHIMSAEDENLNAYKRGAMGFLTKPISPQVLENSFNHIEDFIAREIKSLLLVEDDANLRHSVKQLLAGNDVQIVEAGTGQAALRFLQQQPFDCMILDLTLPDMTGFEVLSQLNVDATFPKCPVIVYTGKALTEEENQALLKYADSVIVKGVKSPERLLDETALFLHRVVAEMPEDKQRTIKRLHDPEALLAGKRILLVDDDARNAFALSRLLADRGLRVTIARSGAQALDKLAQSDFDLVLMDIMMPEMDGYETMGHIRQQPKFRNLPILALTAKAMKGDREKCIAAGANDYLTKPVDAERLFSMLRVWLYQ